MEALIPEIDDKLGFVSNTLPTKRGTIVQVFFEDRVPHDFDYYSVQPIRVNFKDVLGNVLDGQIARALPHKRYEVILDNGSTHKLRA